jgi:hypothetical protein
MAELFDDLISYLEDYCEDMKIVDGSLIQSVFNNLSFTEEEFSKLLIFSDEYCKQANKVKDRAAFFMEGFMLAMYLVGRAYDLEYTDFRNAIRI